MSSPIGPRICLGCWVACGRSVIRRASWSARMGRSTPTWSGCGKRSSGQRRGTGSSSMTISNFWAATFWAIASGHGAPSLGRLFDLLHLRSRSTKLRDYEPWRRELLEQGVIEERDAGWMTGYFMLVDRDQVGDIGPDMNLPDPCTAIDTSYSVAIRARGYAARVWCLTSATTRKKRSGRTKRSSTESSGICSPNGVCSIGTACSTRAASSSGLARPTGAGKLRSALMSNKLRHGSGCTFDLPGDDRQG